MEPAELRIPFVNLRAQIQRLRPELLAAAGDVLDDCEFIQGSHMRDFEAGFAIAHGVPLVAGCSNGTSAITLVLRALGVGPGDEVITVAHTFFATAEAILAVGARPVFVDIDPGGFGMDPQRLESAIGPATRAIVPVHLYGNPCDMDAIMAVANARGVPVVEDCAQAHLATWRGRPVGSLGAAGTFSFYPGKNLGACGDAGCVVTADETLVARVRKLRDHGRLDKYRHDLVGTNERMDGLQAAMLGVKLRHIEAWTRTRRAHARRYLDRLEPAGVRCVRVLPGAEPVWHLFVVSVPDRDAVASRLKAAGIGTGVHYPIPLHLQPALAHLGGRPGDLPHTEAAAGSILSLPLCAELEASQVDEVCDTLLHALSRG